MNIIAWIIIALAATGTNDIRTVDDKTLFFQPDAPYISMETPGICSAP